MQQQEELEQSGSNRHCQSTTTSSTNRTEFIHPLSSSSSSSSYNQYQYQNQKQNDHYIDERPSPTLPYQPQQPQQQQSSSSSLINMSDRRRNNPPYFTSNRSDNDYNNNNLDDGTNTTVISTTATTIVPSTTVASILQSAAKNSFAASNNNTSKLTPTASATATNSGNTLEGQQQSKLFPDNEYDDFVHSLFHSANASNSRHPTTTANLSSLQVKHVLPILPTEQDRKRFIGCIAAMIVSLYQYETRATIPPAAAATTNSTTENSKGQKGNSTQSTTMSNYDNDNNDNSNDDPDTSIHDLSNSFYDDAYVDDNSYEEEDDDSFDYFDSDCDNNDDSTSNLQKQQFRASSKKTRPSTTSTSNSTTSTSTAGAAASGGGGGFFTSKSHIAMIKAQKRYCERRYKIYAQFLIDSTKQLQLDVGHGRCFLPLLEQLLIPPPPVTTTSKSTNNNISTNEGQQEQQRWYRRKSTKNTNFYNVDYIQYQMDDIKNLRPFLEGLSYGAGIRCVSMLLLQHLLLTSGNTVNGYDARIRHLLKSVGVIVLLHDQMLEQQENEKLAFEQRKLSLQSTHYSTSNPTDVLFIDETNDEYDNDSDNSNEVTPMILATSSSSLQQKNKKTSKQQNVDNTSPQEIFPADLVTLATRQFESLEQYLANKLIELSSAGTGEASKSSSGTNNKSSKAATTGTLMSSSSTPTTSSSTSTRDRFLRGLKIGGTAVAAGTIFAITGGLAAPAIAAGVAAVVGTSGLATAAITLTTHAAVTTIFGVGGGSLVAYKMKRRTVGLTEFEFTKEVPQEKQSITSSQASSNKNKKNATNAELFCTICISGWLRDDCDYQRPWGVIPTNPPIDDKLELLERFYSVHRPGHVVRCPKILESWKNEEKQLWKLLLQTYQRDPDHLYPLDDGPRFRGSLTLEQKEAVEKILIELGCTAPTTSDNRKQSSQNSRLVDQMQPQQQPPPPIPHQTTDLFSTIFREDSIPSTSKHGFDDILPHAASGNEAEATKVKHLATVWDYHATYGGELYTVRWESDLIEELCMSVIDLAADVVTGATTHLLKFTVLSALAAALAVPAALKSAANMIDGTWTLVVERSDLAGKELAQSLLFSTAGNRPVNLVGFSFGARVIYSCLKELARYQEKWEDYQAELTIPMTERQKKELKNDSNHEYMRKMREPASIVGDVILMGLPNHMSHASWSACRQVVAGRLVNCYSRKDLILSLMFQYKKFGFKPVCGTCPVDVPGVENYDVSDIVLGHQDYCYISGTILQRVRYNQPYQHDHIYTMCHPSLLSSSNHNIAKTMDE